MFTKTFIFIVLFLISFSCKKSGNTYVKGTIYISGTDSVLENATVYLWKSNYSFGYGQKEGPLLDCVKTNVNGEYKINFSKNPGSNFYVHCKKSGYTWTEHEYKLKHNKTAKNFALKRK